MSTNKKNNDTRSESGYLSSSTALDFNLPYGLDDSLPRLENDSILSHESTTFPSFFLSSELSSQSPFHGKGILFDRIKEAHDTIENLSAKLFQCENDISILNERKTSFEQGYYNLLTENQLLRTEIVSKEKLLEKVNFMSEQVNKLLKTQENLVEKYHKQTNKLELLEVEKKMLSSENNQLKDLNATLSTASEQDALNVEKIKASESKLNNKFMILQIEKNALSSEYDRVVRMYHNEEDKCNSLENQLQSSQSTIKNFEKSKKIQSEKFSSYKERTKLLQQELQKVSQEYLTMKTEVTESNQKSDSEKQKLMDINTDLQKQLDTYKNKVSVILPQNENLQHRVEELDSSVNTLSVELEESFLKVATLEDRLLSNQAKTENYKQKLNLSENASNESEKRQQKLKAKFKCKMNELDQEIDLMKTNSKKMEENYQAEISRIITTYSVEVEKLSNEIEAVEEKNKQLQCEIDSVQKNNDRLEQQVTSLNSKIGENHVMQQSEISSLNITKTNLQNEFDNLKKLVDEYKEQIVSLENNLQSMTLEMTESNSLMNEKIIQIETLQKDITQLTSENAELKRDSKENLNLIQVINEQSKNELEHEKQTGALTIKKLESQIQHLEDKLAFTVEEMECLHNSQQKHLTQLVEKHKEELQELTDKNITQEKVFSALKSELTSTQKEKGNLNNLRNDQVILIDNLKGELESMKKDLQKMCSLEKTKVAQERSIKDLEKQVLSFKKENQNLVEEKKKSSLYTNELLERLNWSLQDAEKQKEEYQSQKENFISKEQKLKKDLYEMSSKNERLKNELRQKALSKPSIQEVETLKSDFDNVNKELQVLTELNKKLEEVNKTTQDENNLMHKNNEQLQCDIVTLKSSFEGLLAKELEKQRSEHLLRENDLLKKLSKLSMG